MAEHICGRCFMSMFEHSSDCGEEVCFEQRVWHWPPLCCSGCPCGSYEDAHAWTALAEVHQ